MLELINIKKNYPAGDGVVEALRGIDLRFRESEFVSILGPSGCGKTTMLNIIGGLDQYTEGDLVIGGRSTKDFRDRDWDTYRNHSVGFVFQSYNLIPHQSVLQNVELALTLSGVSKSERRRRAVRALEEVGLGNQLRKRPSEMSGGQMQRVAIARAIVNDPDIILADEPTGALDTETSVQVMEILKGISKDRLVIMVTHNPDLAERYSTRIIRMLDGKITGDTNPLTEEETAAQRRGDTEKAAAAGKTKKPSMSLWTSFGLSLKNLFTKKGRTALTSFAGSIGIIGIALIYAVSQGTTNYINLVQEDTLGSYPLTLEATHIDLGTLLQTFIGATESAHDHEMDAVYSKSVVYDLINSLNNLEESKNDLASFKKYLETHRADEEDTTGLADSVSGVQYTYDMDLLVYTENVDGTIIRSDSTELLRELIAEHMGGGIMSSLGGNAAGGSMSMFSGAQGGSSMRLWQELLPGDHGAMVNSLLLKQYDIYGSWPTAYNEIVLVLDENNELDDMTLYALGLKSKDDIDAIMTAAMAHKDIQVERESWSYDEILGMEFRVILNADCYTLDESTGLYTDLRETEAGMRYLYDNALKLRVTGILRPNEDAVATMLTGSIGYTDALTQYIIENTTDSAAVQAQIGDPHTDIFSGLPFRDTADTLTEAQTADAFRAHIETLDTAGKAAAYMKIAGIPPKELLESQTEAALAAMTREDMENAMVAALSSQMGMSSADISAYIAAMSDEEILSLFRKSLEQQITAQYAAGVQQKLASMDPAVLAGMLDMAMPSYTDEQCASYYLSVLTFSESDYDTNISLLGCVDLDSPSTINLYASTFAAKDMIEEAIADYNDSVDELSRIAYTDYVGLMMSSITTVINAITYVLIAFVAVSLVVSSIMIGVITLISVQERTKEIGILRAIGASKRNVSSMFNAETVIIGFTSGMLGVLITYLLCIPINLILHYLTKIETLSATLPIPFACFLVAVSVLLTLISGIIPSRSAAKKDPVVALRTE